MSYTYLQDQGEESSVGCFSDIPPFVLSKLNLTVEKSCCKDKEMGSCQGSRSGMMSEHLTENLGKEKPTLCAVGSPVKISVQPEKAQESPERDLAYGLTWPALLAKYNPDTALWKTAQCSLFEDLTECSLTLPRWGMMRSGELSERTMPEHLTKEIESGFWGGYKC